MKRNKLGIFDFDGNLTLLDEEFSVIRPQFLEMARARTGLSTPAFETLMAQLEARVMAQSHCYGRRYNGHIVTDPCVDPYVMLRTLCDLALEESGALTSE